MASDARIGSDRIRKVTFDKAMRGYRSEDVDAFLQEVAAGVDTLTAERDAAQKAVEDNEGKMMVLAQKVEEYRGQEETLKTALINAQRMGETVVHEAKQKADSLVREATGTAELLRQKAEQEIAREQLTLEKLQAEVTRFKATILNLYKQHIESLSALDEPVRQIDDLMSEYELTRPDDEEDGVEEEYADEEEYDEEDAEYDEDEEEDDTPDEVPVVNLFEGVPIDSENE